MQNYELEGSHLREAIEGRFGFKIYEFDDDYHKFRVDGVNLDKGRLRFTSDAFRWYVDYSIADEEKGIKARRELWGSRGEGDEGRAEVSVWQGNLGVHYDSNGSVEVYMAPEPQKRVFGGAVVEIRYPEFHKDDDKETPTFVKMPFTHEDIDIMAPLLGGNHGYIYVGVPTERVNFHLSDRTNIPVSHPYHYQGRRAGGMFSEIKKGVPKQLDPLTPVLFEVSDITPTQTHIRRRNYSNGSEWNLLFPTHLPKREYNQTLKDVWGKWDKVYEQFPVSLSTLVNKSQLGRG